MNRAMATQLLTQLQTGHAKDFVNVANFLNLQCKGSSECEQVKNPLVTRKDNVIERLHNLIHIRIGNANASRTASGRPA